MLEFADSFRPRRWAIESAGGLGFLLAQQLVRAGEDVVDAPHAGCASAVAMVPGGVQRRISAAGAARRLRAIHPDNAVEAARKEMALQLVADIRRLDRNIAKVKKRTTTAVAASGTTVTDVYGVGPIVAALLIGQTGDITRFPTKAHYASYNGTAPIEASSGKVVRHRLNQRGNRQLYHALHMASVTQISRDNPGRTYYAGKIEAGKSKKEARRALKRKISDAVFRQLRNDARPQTQVGPGGQPGHVSDSSATGTTP